MHTPAARSAPVNAALVNWLLVGIEDLRQLEARQCLLERVEAERGIHRVRQPPGEHRPARPVHDRDEIEEAAPDPLTRNSS
jgi:hypothetical protein